MPDPQRASPFLQLRLTASDMLLGPALVIHTMHSAQCIGLCWTPGHAFTLFRGYRTSAGICSDTRQHFQSEWGLLVTWNAASGVLRLAQRNQGYDIVHLSRPEQPASQAAPDSISGSQSLCPSTGIAVQPVPKATLYFLPGTSQSLVSGPGLCSASLLLRGGGKTSFLLMVVC